MLTATAMVMERRMVRGLIWLESPFASCHPEEMLLRQVAALALFFGQ
jgi:hypothetical protein